MELSATVSELPTKGKPANGSHIDPLTLGKEALPTSFLEPTIRLARERAEAAEYVDNLLTNTRIALTGIAMLHGPVFNPEAVSSDALYSGIKRFETEVDTFRKLILGRSATVKG